MFKKIRLFTHIREFYKVFFADTEAFINKLSDMTKDNVNDVLFDIHEVLDANFYGCYGEDGDDVDMWLTELEGEIINFCEPRRSHTKAIALLIIAITVLALMSGYYMGRHHTIRQAELLDINGHEYNINFGDEVHTYTFEEGI